VLTAAVLAEAQERLNEGMEKTEVAACLEVPSDTLRKALADGRLVARPRAAAVDKSARSVEDASAATGMGTACTRAFYYPQVQAISAPGILLEYLDVCFDELLDDLSHPGIVGDHLSHCGQPGSGNIHDSRLLLAILVGQAVCPPR
jgi:hypothetical protein